MLPKDSTVFKRLKSDDELLMRRRNKCDDSLAHFYKEGRQVVANVLPHIVYLYE